YVDIALFRHDRQVCSGELRDVTDLVELTLGEIALLVLEPLHGIFGKAPSFVGREQPGAGFDLGPIGTVAERLVWGEFALVTVGVTETDDLVGRAVVESAGVREDVIDLDEIGEELLALDRLQAVGA